MKFDLRKALSGFLLFSGCIGYVYGDDQSDQMQSTQSQPSNMMPQNDITPSANPRVNDGCDFYITADFIYWNIREDGLAFVASGASPSTDTSVTQQGQVYRPDFQWRPGFKVGAGFDLGHDGWDLYAQYTWLRSNTSTTTVTAPSDSTSTLVLAGIAQDAFTLQEVVNGAGDVIDSVITLADSRWKVQFNAVDAEMARNYFISRFLVLRPFFGVKGAWQTQNLNTGFNYSFTPVATTEFFSSSLSQRMNFWGVGLRTGMGADFHFDRMWSFCGNMALSGLWSRFSDRRSDKLVNLATGVSTVEFSTQNVLHTLVPVVEWSLGVKWENWFWDDTWHVALSAAWEEQIWFAMNQFFVSYDDDNHGNLVTGGLDVRFRLDF